MKKKHDIISDQSVKDIIAYIREFLRDGDDFRINQGYFGMEHLLWGYTINIWEGADFSMNKYQKCNSILIKAYTKYYYTC